MRQLIVRYRLAVIACAAAALVAGALSAPRGAPALRRVAARAPSPARTVPPARTAAPAHGRHGRGIRHAAAVRPLSALQLAGQRVIYSYNGLQAPPSLLAAIRAGEVGGVIFFAPNIASAGQLRAVTARLQSVSLASPLHDRLLLLTDQEGGEVRRLSGGPALSEKQIGSSTHPVSAAGAAGASAAEAIRAAGLNVNLAPVLDVPRHAGDFIDQYQRAYSGDAGRDGTLAAAFISAQQRDHVLATAKHFPGLGAAATAQNTDLGPVTLGVGLTTLRAVDEAPYRRALAAGVAMVMTSWATYPALDAARPAGLSSAVIGGELRGRLGFRGVTITDAIGAGSLTRYGSLGARGVLAAQAGADLILCSEPNPADNSVARDLGVVRTLAAAITAGRVPAGSLHASLQRILALRARLAAA